MVAPSPDDANAALRERVLVLAPTGRDAEAVRAVLAEAGRAAAICADMDALCRELHAGAGALLVAEEALSPPSVAALVARLRAEEPWSDPPIVLLAGEEARDEATVRVLDALEPAGNVTILERPLRKRTLITALSAALRARRRQYRARDAELTQRRLAEENAALARENARLLHETRAALLARDESLAELDALLSISPVGFIIYDERLRIERINDAIAKLHGVPPSACQGRSMAELSPEVALQVTPHLRRVLATGEPVFDRDVSAVLPRGSGEQRHFLSSFLPLRDPSGRLRGVCTVVTDVTHLKRVEEDLRGTIELRERFIGVLGHDLRTPLQAILLTAFKLARAPLPEKAHKDVERIHRAAQRMSDMAADLLDLTRSQKAGGIPIAPVPGDMAELCARVADEVRAAHPGRDIRLETSGDTRGAWDESRVAQVVSNLLGNAVAYGAIEAPVSIRVHGGPREITLAVHNQGPPIPAELLPKLFSPFSRGAHPTNGEPARNGLGLGLYIVDRVVHAHGGTVGVTSSAEHGTTFTVKLPKPAPEPIAAADASAQPATRDGPERRRVLVVEDDGDIRDVLRFVLEGEGYEVLDACDGREALDVLARGARPCVVLLDLMMPVMDGWEVLDHLRADGTLDELPVLVVSAADGGSPPSGARRYLPKPIELPTLLAAVREQCSG